MKTTILFLIKKNMALLSKGIEMKKTLETILGFLGLCLFSLFIAYSLIHALDAEAELQEQKNIDYMYERGLK